MFNNDTKFENPRLKVRKLQKLGFLGSKTYFSFIGNLVDHRPIQVNFDRKYKISVLKVKKQKTKQNKKNKKAKNKKTTKQNKTKQNNTSVFWKIKLTIQVHFDRRYENPCLK